MTTLDCRGLLGNVGMWCDSITVEEDDSKPSFVAYSRHGDCHLAVITGTVLTIATALPGSKYQFVCEMEFENPIELICWGVDASCLIAGDACGSLHFITPSGQLIFSHRILSKSEESAFAYLGCSGKGKLQSLLAVFQNGKVFGIADFAAESICNIAINEPQSLSAAIRKMKFLRAGIKAEYPLIKVLMHISPYIATETSNGDVLERDHEGHTPLFITVITSNGDLLVGPIGTTSALQIESIPKIKGLVNAPSPTYQMKCIDVALLNSSIAGPSSCANPPESCRGIALFSGGLIAIVDLSAGTIISTLRINLPSANRISLLSSRASFSSTNSHSTPESEWLAAAFGIETKGEQAESTNLFVLLHKSTCHDKPVVLQLGSDGTSTSCIDSSSPPTDTVFCKQSTDSNSSSSTILGRKISNAVWNCISTILRGLNDDATTLLQPCHDNSETSLMFLIGRILNLRMSVQEESEGSIPCKNDSNPFGVEELLDRSLEVMTSLHSSGEILVLLKALFVCVYDPPDMFLNKVVEAATVAMGKVRQVDKDDKVDRCKRDVDDLRRCTETARCMSIKILLNGTAYACNDSHSLELTPELAKDSASEEEMVRRRVLALTANMNRKKSLQLSRTSTSHHPHSEDLISHERANVWAECLKCGALQDASLIMSQHLKGAVDVTESAMVLGERSSESVLSSDMLLKAFKSIPEETSPYDIVSWLKADLLPRLHMWGKVYPHQSLDEGQALASQVVMELCKRASLSARILLHPFDALIAAEQAVSIASSFSRPLGVGELPSALGVIAMTSRSILKHLQIQACLWRNWGSKNRPTLEDVEEIGLCGLVRERLWTLNDSEIDITKDVMCAIKPVLLEFGYSSDDVLQSWISDAVSERVVLFDDRGDKHSDDCEVDIRNHDDAEDHCCSLSRLVSVSSLIDCPRKRIISLLLLFQVPAVDLIEEFSSDLGEHGNGNESFHEDENVQSNGHDNKTKMSVEMEGVRRKEGQIPQVMKKRGVDTVTRLCTLAQAACLLVDAGAAEAITEAIRLKRIKSLAASYGVISFDPRDKHQIRAVASIIALKGGRVHALRDAMEFASSWGTDSADLSGLLTRATVHRATSSYGDAETGPDDGSHRDVAVRNSLIQVPSHRLLAVVEDSCTYLLESLKDITDASLAAGSRLGKLSSTEDEVQASILVRSVLCVASVYLDTSRAGDEIKAPLVSPNPNEKTPSQVIKSTISSNSSWVTSDFLSCMKRLRLLQSEGGLYLSYSDLKNAIICAAAATHIAEEQADIMISTIPIKSISDNDNDNVAEKTVSIDSNYRTSSALTPHTRRLCALLGVSPIFYAHTVIKKLIAKDACALSIDMARYLGDEDSTSTSTVHQEISGVNGQLGNDDVTILLDTAVTLCSLAAKDINSSMNRTGSRKAATSTASATAPVLSLHDVTAPFLITRNLLRGITSICPAEHLGRSLDILNGSELVLAVYQRVEGVHSDEQHTKSKPSNAINGTVSPIAEAFKINQSAFSRDGILMASSAVMGLVLRYSAAEVRRRISITATVSRSSMAGEGGTNSEVEEEVAGDLDELVCALQRSENHMLALRVLLSSWHMGTTKAQLLRSSLLCLSRKVLSYREIDTSLAVACLVMLPYDAMVRELKGAVPSIQSDFSRLRTVACVGEELARLWDQEALLVVFQGLQTNARWWHVISVSGLKIDPRAFQSSDPIQRDICIRAVVPELLERSDMDLEQTIDYCRQFNIESEYATLCYVEKLLVQIPKGPISNNILSCNETKWARQIRKATLNIDEKTILKSLRIFLPKVHPLDYERIRFLSSWIVTALEEEEEMEQDNTIQRNLKQSKDGEIKKLRTVSCGEKATEEAELCRKYTDIVTYLAGIQFPVEATRKISQAILNRHSSASASSSSITVDQCRGPGAPSPSPSPTPLSSSPSPGGAGTGTGTDWEFNCYADVGSMYLSRIPFWILLTDPWLVITPLLTEAPETAAKLQPVCRALNIDKDDFTIRRVIALYDRSNSKSTHAHTGGVAASTESNDATYVLAAELLTTVQCVVKRTQLWKVLFTNEREKKKDVSATMYLMSGLKEIDTYRTYLKQHKASLEGLESSDVASTVDKMQNLREGMTSSLTLMRCEETLRDLDRVISSLFISSSDTLSMPSFSALLQHVEEPSLLLRKALITTAEGAWDAQLWSLRTLGYGILCSREIPRRPMCPAVVAYLRIAGTAILSIAAHTQYTAEVKPVPGSDSAPHGTGGLNGIESLRHSMIGKMLADVDSASCSGGKDINLGNLSGGSSLNALTAGLWTSITESSLRVGPAELRKREDVYLGFCIAAMVVCSEECSVPASNPKNITNNKSTGSVIVASPHSPSPGQTSKRASYEIQLQAVVQGKGAKSQRRLTTRSRLRAAFALQLLASGTETTNKDVARDVTATAAAAAKISLIGATDGSPAAAAEEHPLPDLNCMMPFLECLAELQETRLPCSEEALMDALRPSMSCATTASFLSPLSSSLSSSSVAVKGKMKEQRHARADARALVRTWLHDEGYHQEVVELSRDVLLSAGTEDSTAWAGLLTHMNQRAMTRTFVQTIVLLVRLCPVPLGEILHGPTRDIVLTNIRAFTSEVIEKTQQVTALLKSRKEESSTPGAQVDSASDFMSPSSNRVTLVERCTSSCEWEDAPEDLALSLSQLCLLWATISPLGDGGARDTGASLVKIIAEKVNPSSTSAGTLIKGVRTVERMLSQHAEACAMCLLKITSPLHVLNRSTSPLSPDQDRESSFIATLLLHGLRQEPQSRPEWNQHDTITETLNFDYFDSRRLLWKILCTCCIALPDLHVRTALTKICITDQNENKGALQGLLRCASESWHGGGESCDATLLLLSWCISVATSSSSSTSTLEDGQRQSSVNRSDCLQGREIVLSALKSLSSTNRSNLELAAEMLAFRLSAAERVAVRHMFIVPA